MAQSTINSLYAGYQVISRFGQRKPFQTQWVLWQYTSGCQYTLSRQYILSRFHSFFALILKQIYKNPAGRFRRTIR